MPEKRGRRRRVRDRRARGESSSSAIEPAVEPVRAASRGRSDVPSNTARATGFGIAVITVFLAILTIADAFTGERATVDATVRVAVGLFLVVLGVVVGALSLFPAQIRRMIRGG